VTDRISDTSTENCTAPLAHLAFCALVALAFARRDGVAGTPGADNLFLVRWLATAQKQKRFPKSVAVDIAWLLERGRKHGPAGRLVQHLEYLWRSCSGDLKAQSDLFRLTRDTETLKDRGRDSVVLTGRQKADAFPAGRNAFYVTKGILSASCDRDGRLLCPYEVTVTGDARVFVAALEENHIRAQVSGGTESHTVVTVHP